MMATGRDDRWVSDGLGRALAGAEVYWCAPQPAVTTSDPPSPLATIYTDTTGDTPEGQPIFTDGFGHAWAYLTEGVLFTVVIWHPLFGNNPIVIPDQQIGGGGSSQYTPFSETPSGVIDGSNRVFTLTQTPVAGTAWLNVPLINGLGYTLSGNTITYAVAPQPAGGSLPTADVVYFSGWY